MKIIPGQPELGRTGITVLLADSGIWGRIAVAEKSWAWVCFLSADS